MDKTFREELKTKVLEALTNNPMDFTKLSSNLCIPEGSPHYSRLLEVVSTMQNPFNIESEPLLKNALPLKNSEGKLVYPIYIVEEEKKLIQEGRLSEEEIVTDLYKYALEIGLPKLFGFLKESR